MLSFLTKKSSNLTKRRRLTLFSVAKQLFDAKLLIKTLLSFSVPNIMVVTCHQVHSCSKHGRSQESYGKKKLLALKYFAY